LSHLPELFYVSFGDQTYIHTYIHTYIQTDRQTETTSPLCYQCMNPSQRARNKYDDSIKVA